MRKVENGRFIPTPEDEDWEYGAIHYMGLSAQGEGQISHLAHEEDGPWLDWTYGDGTPGHPDREAWVESLREQDRDWEMDEVKEANNKLVPMLYEWAKRMEETYFFGALHIPGMVSFERYEGKSWVRE